MTRVFPGKRLLLGALAAVLFVFHAAPGVAGEPVEKFLDGLRRREMFEAAIMYVESLRSRPDIPAEVKTLLTYEEGRTLVEQALAETDAKKQSDALDAAAAKFQEFLNKHPNHDRVPATGRQLGRILKIRADRLVEQAARPVNAAQSEQMLKDAREYYKQALAAYEAAEKKLDQLVKESRPWLDGGTSEQKDRAQTVRADYLQIRLDIGEIVYLQAIASPEKSKERKDLLADSVKKFDEFAKQFRRYHAGSYALMYQARSLMALASAETDEKKAEQSRKQATALLAQLYSQIDSDPVVRSLQFQAVRLSMANHLDAKEPEVDQAVKLGEQWNEVFRGREETEEDALGIKLLLARAQKLKHAAAQQDADKRRIARAAVDLARFVAKYPGPYRDEARSIMAELGEGAASGDPQTFQEAFDLAKQNLETSRVYLNEMASASDDAAREDLKKKQKEAEQAAFDMFRTAMKLRNAGDTPASQSDIDQVRYFQTYLYFQQDDPWRAAVMGEFLARRSPNSTGARPASAIALASYSKLYNAAPADKRAFEAQKMEELATFITDNWPEDDVARQATLALLDVMRAAGNRAKVVELLDKVPADSPSRVEVELKVGDFLWKEYLRDSRIPQGSDAAPTADELAAMSTRAEELLESGVKGAAEQSGNEPTASLLAAKLSLVQLYTRSGQTAEALALLTAADPPGLLTLVENKHPVVERLGGFKPEVLRLALQAYVGNNDQEKAVAVMDDLENEFKGQGSDAQARLTRIYIRLGLELQEDLKRYKQEGKTDQYKKTLDATKAFLTRIAARQQGVTFTVLSWISETFYNLGESADGADAREFYSEAKKAYERMLGNKDAGFWPDQNTDAYKTRTKIQLARCLRGLGDYEGSLKLLKEILAASKSNLDVQREAAETLQAWGAAEKDTEKLLMAMMGDPPRGNDKEIWGWDYMSRVLQTFVGKLRNEARTAADQETAALKASQAETYSGRFHECRYNMAMCLFEFAKAQTDGERRTRYLGQAEKAIALLVPLYPDMGGEEWYPRYDTLLRDIQRQQGNSAAGLSPLVKSVQEKQAATTP